MDKVFILVTGDIAFSGQIAQYLAFNEFKKVLVSSLKKKGLKGLFHIFIVPGNHDIDYSYIKDHDREYYENYIESKEDICDDTNEISARTQFLNYSGRNHGIHSHNPLFRRNVVTVNDFTIEINLLNSTFFSLKTKNDQGLHYMPANTIADLSSPTGADMAITLMHHSHQWFNDSCHIDLEKTLFEKNTMIFYGHEHYLAGKEIAYNGNTPAHVFCGGSLCNGSDWTQSEFFACVYDTDKQEFVRYGFRWDGKAKIYHKESLEKRRILPKRSTNIPQNINTYFVNNVLKDNHFSISENLSDYYVFPGVTRTFTGKDEYPNDIIEFEQFMKVFEKSKRLEISGNDSCGKSALLRMIFKYFLLRKCILYCKVEDISSGNRRRIIKNLFECMYGEDPTDYEKFERSDKLQKIILIDDLHLINPKHISGFLSGIEDEFGYIIYTTNNTLKLDIEERIKTAIIQDSYVQYRILPLYDDKRRKLVDKVIPLKNPSITRDNQTALTEKIVHSLNLQRRYIPLTPEITLQFVEYYMAHQLESAQNDGNIFSKIFEASITNALSPFIKSPLTVDKAFTVLGKIAFYIHNNKQYPITNREIIDVISNYCTEYGGTIDSIDFISSVCKSHIVNKYNDDGLYKFCNNNYLAYFVAFEICASKEIDAIQNCLVNACFGINATILLFVTYLTNDHALIDRIVSIACQVSLEWKEFSFNMKELSHINNQVRFDSKVLPPSTVDRNADKLADDQKDRQEMENSTIDIINIYDYNEEDVIKVENQLGCAIALLSLLSRCLPNFEHRLKKYQKEKIISVLYQLPNKIHWAWASEVEQQKDELVQFALDLETDDYTRHKISVDEIRSLIQWNSLSVLLELYYIVANNAYRENTFEYLYEMADDRIDFSEETHCLERLIILDKAKRIPEFQILAKNLKSSTKRSTAQLALLRVVRHLLIKGGPNIKQAAQLEQEFFPYSNHAATLYSRKNYQKKNA